MIEGVAAPESANNAAAQTSFIPMLTLGIPSNAVMAMMIGGMMIHGIVPGPQVMEQKPGLFWGMIVSMWIGNLMLVVLNLPLIGIWVRMLLVPYRLLSIAILFFCCIGVYSLNNSANEVLFIAFFGVVGYLFMKLDCEPAPLLMGFLLGPMMEVYMRRAMLLSRGDPLVFLQRPLSLSFLRDGRIAAAVHCAAQRPQGAGRWLSASELTAAMRPRILRTKQRPGRNMMRRRDFLALAGAALAAGFSTEASAQAQSWPERAVKLILPYAPGGATDAIGRPWADKLSQAFGQQFVIENRGGAGGMIGAEAAAKSPPDGYTLLSHAQRAALGAADPAQDRLRSRQELRSGRARRRCHLRLRHSPLGRRQDPQGDDRVRQEEPGQAHLRLVGQRHCQPSADRDAQAQDRHRHPARALSRRRRLAQRRAARHRAHDERAGVAARTPRPAS